MNWDRIEGKWKEFSGLVRQKWGKLTDDDLTTVKATADSQDRPHEDQCALACFVARPG